MTNSWPDDNAEYQASDIDKILDEELKNNKPVLRPTDRKWNHVTPEPEVKAQTAPTFIARFLAAVIAIAIVSLILLVLFGLLLQVFQWVAGMVR